MFSQVHIVAILAFFAKCKFERKKKLSLFCTFGNLFIFFSRFLAVFADAACSRTYEVQDGDICDGISKKESVSTFVFFLALKNRFLPSV